MEAILTDDETENIQNLVILSPVMPVLRATDSRPPVRIWWSSVSVTRAFRYAGMTGLLAQVERPAPLPRKLSIARLNQGEVNIRRFDLNDPSLDLSHPRKISTRVTRISHADASTFI